MRAMERSEAFMEPLVTLSGGERGRGKSSGALASPLPGASLSLSLSLEFSGAGTQFLAEIGREQEEALLGGENLLHSSDGFMLLFLFSAPFG